MLDKWVILLAGMGTVFVALIGLIAMLALFKYIFGGRQEKKRAPLAPLPEINSPIPQARPSSGSAPFGLDSAVVAAIVAAVSAASGRAPGDFRIAAIAQSGNEAGFNTPIWGRIERFLRG